MEQSFFWEKKWNMIFGEKWLWSIYQVLYYYNIYLLQ